MHFSAFLVMVYLCVCNYVEQLQSGEEIYIL